VAKREGWGSVQYDSSTFGPAHAQDENLDKVVDVKL
jgi:hypothetical protein